MNEFCRVSSEELKNDALLGVDSDESTKESLFNQDLASLRGSRSNYSDNAEWLEENIDLDFLLKLYANNREDPLILGESLVVEFDGLLKTELFKDD